MALFNRRDEYGWMTQLLHWLLFLLLLGLLTGGKYSASLSPGDKIGFLIGMHQQIGLAVFVLMAFRLLWRMINTNVQPEIKGMTHYIAYITHWLLYVAVLAQAATGVMMTQMANRGVAFFGAYPLPSFANLGASLLDSLTEKAPQLTEFLSLSGSPAMQMRAMHGYISDVLIALIVLHILGALYHHLIVRDDTLRRMIFGYRPSYARGGSAFQRRRFRQNDKSGS